MNIDELRMAMIANMEKSIIKQTEADAYLEQTKVVEN
jgi:hypothetical protein